MGIEISSIQNPQETEVRPGSNISACNNDVFYNQLISSSNWAQIVRRGHMWAQMVRQVTRRVTNGQKRSEEDTNGQKQSDEDTNGHK